MLKSQKDCFNQKTVCEAPLCWPKYTTDGTHREGGRPIKNIENVHLCVTSNCNLPLPPPVILCHKNANPTPLWPLGVTSFMDDPLVSLKNCIF